MLRFIVVALCLMLPTLASALKGTSATVVSIGYTDESDEYSVGNGRGSTVELESTGRGVTVDLHYYDADFILANLSLRYLGGDNFAPGPMFTPRLDIGGYQTFHQLLEKAGSKVRPPDWFDLGLGGTLGVGYNILSSPKEHYDASHFTFAVRMYSFVRILDVFVSFGYGIEGRPAFMDRVNALGGEPGLAVQRTLQAGWVF